MITDEQLAELAALTDEALDAQRRAILTEQERRANLAALPGQVRALADQYEACGGNRTDLTTALAGRTAA